ncbi:MAG: hypothetical protein AUG44_03510 [Actinobacteria bacterium 13_1_20CM_3_71_11]|nr:MAG: hypothetical protein AUG44_03510 [Actinobacteria bacterium 13_1_20CM_3_71_11]
MSAVNRPALVPVNAAARVFYALGSDVRFRVLVAVKKGHATARRIEVVLGLSEGQTRRALNLLEQADLVVCSRQGARRADREAHVYRVTAFAESLVVLVRDELSPVKVLRHQFGDERYEREDPETGDPLPANVTGFPVGGRAGHRSFTSAERGR